MDALYMVDMLRMIVNLCFMQLSGKIVDMHMISRVCNCTVVLNNSFAEHKWQHVTSYAYNHEMFSRPRRCAFLR